MSEYRVLDISAYQKNVPYSKLQSTYGIKAAILRVTERYNIVDSMFDKHYKGLTKANIPIVGVYKFSYAMNITEIQQEAKVVASTLKKYPDFKGVVYLDLEYDGQLGLTKATLTSMIKAFRKIIIDAGYKFGIYCNTNWYQNYLDTAKLPYDFWIAAYPFNDYGEIVERLRPNLKRQIAWQYTSKFKINGENYDMSVFNSKYIDDLVGDVEILDAKKEETIVIVPPDTTNDVIERATKWMEDAVNDNSHGYDQIYRQGEYGDYDCSSAVINAWQSAGVPVKSNGATYTGNMYDVFTKLGFVDVTSSVNLSTGAGLVRGDVLLNHVHHTAMYIGNGYEAEFSINEKGTATWGQPGDQTGREALVMRYRNYPWNCVLRYKGSGITTVPSVSETLIDSYPTLQYGSKGQYVLKIQKFLNELGYNLVEDGEFGKKTESAIIKFQKIHHLEADGIVGPITLSAITEEYSKIASENWWVGQVTVDGLNVRTGPGTNYSIYAGYPQLYKGNLIDICKTVNDWYYIRIAGKHFAYVHSDYVKRM